MHVLTCFHTVASSTSMLHLSKGGLYLEWLTLPTLRCHPQFCAHLPVSERIQTYQFARRNLTASQFTALLLTLQLHGKTPPLCCSLSSFFHFQRCLRARQRHHRDLQRGTRGHRSAGPAVGDRRSGIRVPVSSLGRPLQGGGRRELPAQEREL